MKKERADSILEIYATTQFKISSRLLFKITKIKIYKNTISPVILCKKRGEVKASRRKLHNSFPSPNIRINKSRKIKRMGQIGWEKSNKTFNQKT